jgi:RimJ/RimL family protein N-acetyltransferase
VSEHRHPQTDQPVGAPIDTRPALRPGPVTLSGRFARLEKLASVHAAELWAGLKDAESVWTYMPNYGPFADAAAFARWIGERAALEDPYSYVIVAPDRGAVGILALMAIRPDHRVVEVGNVLYAPAIQRTPIATEAQYLLARYVFEMLGYRRYEWKCDALNAPSRRAALRYGFVFEGIFRQHMIARGRNRDTAWFAMTGSEWPTRKAAFERWLAPANFDAAGRQIEPLSRPASAGL